MKRNHLILIILFFITFAVASVGIKDCYDSSGNSFHEKYYLRGPDAYYNMRMCKQQIEGDYSTHDDNLAYPYGHEKRPLFFTVLTTNIAYLVSSFSGMSLMNSLGWTMLLIPCLFGALCIFPVYGIAKEIFNSKIGLLSAIVFSMIPILYNTSSGITAGAFDHDAFLMFLFILFYYLFIKSFASGKKSYYYSILSAIPLAIIYMTWVAHEFIFVSIMIFLFIYIFYTIIKKVNAKIVMFKILLMLDITLLLILPYAMVFDTTYNIVFYSAIAMSIIYFLYYYLKMHILSVLAQFLFVLSILASFVTILYAIKDLAYSPHYKSLTYISSFLFKSGGYSSKIMRTIQEAQALTLTDFMINYGFILFIFAILGLIVYLYKISADKIKTKDICFLSLFLATAYISTTAGRFITNLLPFVAIFGALFLFLFMKRYVKIDDIKLLKTKSMTILTILFLFFASCSYITYNTVKSQELMLEDEWTEVCVYIGYGFYDGAILSWWDYGFFIASIADKPVVSDNFQSNIYVTSNFFTAQSEKEAYNVLSVYLIKSEIDIKGDISKNTTDIIKKYLGTYTCKPCDKKTYEKADEFVNVIKNNENNLLYLHSLQFLENKTVQEAHEIYEKIQESTGYNIEYVIITERDVTEIKVLLPYLADKSNVGFTEVEDDWFKITSTDIENRKLFNNSIAMKLYEGDDFLFFEKTFTKDKIKIWRI